MQSEELQTQLKDVLLLERVAQGRRRQERQEGEDKARKEVGRDGNHMRRRVLKRHRPDTARETLPETEDSASPRSELPEYLAVGSDDHFECI